MRIAVNAVTPLILFITGGLMKRMCEDGSESRTGLGLGVEPEVHHAADRRGFAE